MHSNFTWQKIQKSFIQTCGYRSKSVTNQFTGVDVWTGTVKQSARAPVHRAIKAHNKINTQLQGRVFVHIKPKKYPNLDSSSYFISLTSYLSVRTSILSNGINHKSFIVLYIILILMGSMNFWTVFFFCTKTSLVAWVECLFCWINGRCDSFIEWADKRRRSTPKGPNFGSSGYWTDLFKLIKSTRHQNINWHVGVLRNVNGELRWGVSEVLYRK